jgi:hypothetical protein
MADSCGDGGHRDGGASPVAARNKYDPGASDREIKIGNTMAYSGPVSAYGEIGKTYAHCGQTFWKQRELAHTVISNTWGIMGQLIGGRDAQNLVCTGFRSHNC